MKVCLSSQCSSAYLQKADEIKIKLKNRNRIIDYLEKYPEATIILSVRETPEDTEVDWDEIKRIQILCKDNFLFAVVNAYQVECCFRNNINYYLDRPINNYEDIYWLKKMNAKYILIEAPLFFDLKNVKEMCGDACALRICPNVAYYANGVPKENGLTGSWIRPEDIDSYNEFIDTIEFEDCGTRKEEALFRIYMEDKRWPSDLDLLITNLNKTFSNEFAPGNFATMRQNCRQKCFSGSNCNFCSNAATLSVNESFQKRIRGEKKNDTE